MGNIDHLHIKYTFVYMYENELGGYFREVIYKHTVLLD